MISAEQKEYLRNAIVTFTGARPLQNFTVKALTHFVRRDQLVDFEFTEQDVREALEILHGFGYITKVEPSDIGVITTWKASHTGAMRHERAQG